jgi:uncharacterized membrane protein
VIINYEAPGGVLGSNIAKLFGDDPEAQLEDALTRFKQIMEAGEVVTTLGQPTGRVREALS